MKLLFDESDFRPLVELVVVQTVERLADEQARLGSRLGYTEAEAAALLGVPRHTLRDCRLRGQLKARLVGKKMIYSREELLHFLRETSSNE